MLAELLLGEGCVESDRAMGLISGRQLEGVMGDFFSWGLLGWLGK